MRLWRVLVLAMAMAAVLLAVTSFLLKGVNTHAKQIPMANNVIMVRKSSLHRFFKQPCDIETIEYYPGDWIRCERRKDYEARPHKSWAHTSPYYHRPRPKRTGERPSR